MQGFESRWRYESFLCHVRDCLEHAPQPEKPVPANLDPKLLEVIRRAQRKRYQGHFMTQLNQLLGWMGPHQLALLESVVDELQLSLDEKLTFPQGQQVIERLESYRDALVPANE